MSETTVLPAPSDDPYYLPNDTYCTQGFADWRAIVEGLGFEIILEVPIEGTEDHLYCWWRAGLLLTCNTKKGGKRVDLAYVYGNYLGPGRTGYETHLRHSRSIGEVDGTTAWSWEESACSHLRSILESMERRGKHLPVWRAPPSCMWLLTYKEWEKPRGRHDDNRHPEFAEITDSRIDKFPEHVRRAIRGT